MKELSTILRKNIPTKPKSYQQSDLMALQGENASHIFIVDNGWVKILKYLPDGSQNIVDICGPGTLVGLPVLFQRRQIPVSVEALSDVTISILNKENVENFLLKHPEILSLVVVALGRKVLTVKELGVAARGEEALCAVKYLMQHLAVTYGFEHEGGLKIPFQLTQRTITQLLGLSRVSISQCIKILEKERYLKQIDKYYIVSCSIEDKFIC